MASSPESKAAGAPAAAAKTKSDDRRAQLEAFRAAQAAKKAASLGHKTQPPSTAPAKAPKSRTHAFQSGEQSDPNAGPAPAKKAGSLSPDRPKQSRQLGAPRTRPPLPSKSAAPDLRPSEDAPAEAVKPPAWLEAQQAFGHETPRPSDSRRCSAVGETAGVALGPGFGDDGDPNVGIRWQIQMERFRLQQWHILNGRLDAASAQQKQQAEAQLALAANAAAASATAVERLRGERGVAANRQHAAEALAAQVPRLEAYAAMKDAHEESMKKIVDAVDAALQQMPLVNGAVCGQTAEVADPDMMRDALKEIQAALSGLEPRIKPFLGKANTSASKENGLCGTAQAASTLAGVDERLRAHLKGNAELLASIEREVVHAESLATQLALCEEGEAPGTA